MKQLIDKDNQGQIVTFRYSTCSQCTTCKRSPRTTSIQEKSAQEVIERSVDVGLVVQNG